MLRFYQLVQNCEVGRKLFLVLFIYFFSKIIAFHPQVITLQNQFYCIFRYKLCVGRSLLYLQLFLLLLLNQLKLKVGWVESVCNNFQVLTQTLVWSHWIGHWICLSATWIWSFHRGSGCLLTFVAVWNYFQKQVGILPELSNLYLYSNHDKHSCTWWRKAFPLNYAYGILHGVLTVKL